MSRRLVYPLLALLVAAVLGFWMNARGDRQRLAQAEQMVESVVAQSDQAELFSGIKQGFAPEYAGFIRQMAALEQAGNASAQDVAAKARAFTSDLREQNAYYIHSAPLDDIRAIHQATVKLLKAFSVEKPEICVRFAKLGGAGLMLDDLNPEEMRLISQVGAATFAAILAGRDTPVSHPAPQEGDMKAFLQAWQVAEQPGPAVLEAVAKGRGTPGDTCAAFLSLERFLLEDASPLVTRVMVDRSAASAGG